MQDLKRHQPGPPKTPEVRPHLSIRVSGPFLVLGAVILAVTVGWSFVMGFIVGRGEDPGERLARYDPFSRLLDEKNEAAQSATKEGVSQGILEKTGASEQAQEPKGSQEPATATTQSPEPPHPFTRPKGESFAAWGEDGVRVVPQAQDEQKQKPTTELVRSAYFYRVATYKTKAQAEELAKQLQGPLRKSYVEQNGSLYSVYLNAKANDAELSTLRTLFDKLRVKGPKLMAKKESETKPTKVRAPKKSPENPLPSQSPKTAKRQEPGTQEASKKPAPKPARTQGKEQGTKNPDSATKRGESGKSQR